MGRYDPNKTQQSNNIGRWAKLQSEKPPSVVSRVANTVSNFIRETAKEGAGAVLVRPVARYTEAVTRITAPNSLAAKGYETMSDAGQSQKILGVDVAPVKAFGKGGATQIVGEGLQTASWLYGGSAAKSTVKGLTKTAELAARKTFAETAIKQIPELAKVGFIGTAAGTIGNQLQKTAGTNEKIDWEQAAKDIAVGTLATPVVGLALTKLFGTKASKILEARQALRDAEIAANKVKAQNLPAGTKFDNFGKPVPSFVENLTGKIPEIKKTTGVLDNKFTPSVDMGKKPTIIASPNAFVPTPKAVPTTPIEIRAIKNPNKLDFIGQEIQGLQRQGVKISPNVQKQASDAWERMHPIADTSNIIDTPINKTITNGVSDVPIQGESINTTTSQEIPQVDINTPEFKQKVERDTNFLSKLENKADANDIRSFEQSSQRFNERLATDKNSLKEYALGLGDVDPKLPRTSALGLMQKYADETSDTFLAKELSFSDVRSQAGRELGAVNITTETTTSQILNQTRKARAKGLGISENKLQAEEYKLFTELKNKINSKEKFTEEDLTDIISSIIC